MITISHFYISCIIGMHYLWRVSNFTDSNVTNSVIHPKTCSLRRNFTRKSNCLTTSSSFIDHWEKVKFCYESRGHNCSADKGVGWIEFLNDSTNLRAEKEDPGGSGCWVWPINLKRKRVISSPWCSVLLLENDQGMGSSFSVSELSLSKAYPLQGSNYVMRIMWTIVTFES